MAQHSLSGISFLILKKDVVPSNMPTVLSFPSSHLFTHDIDIHRLFHIYIYTKTSFSKWTELELYNGNKYGQNYNLIMEISIFKF